MLIVGQNLKSGGPPADRPGQINVMPVGALASGTSKHLCPICQMSVDAFLPVRPGGRANAKCPGCGCLERHRLFWLYLSQQTPFFKDRLRVLHFAPEKCFHERFKAMSHLAAYLSADLTDPQAMVKMDITHISCPDYYFDVIFCNHVLEHIPDDVQAIRELYRVLRPGGWALIMIPQNLQLEATFEDPNVKTPAQQEQVYGYKGHVRIYGRDFADRLRKGGFGVNSVDYCTQLGPQAVEKYGLLPYDTIYHCSK